jgi:hypothetical protein
MKTRNSATGTKGAANNAKQGRCRRSIQQDSKTVRLTRKMEKLAEEVTTKFSTGCVKLRELKPKVEKIRSYFQENVRGSVTLSGCRSFREFCEKRLRRREQSVYRMLSSDTKKRQEKIRVPKSPAVRQKPVMARDEIRRLRCACFAAVQYFEAEAKGNNAEAKKSKEEFFAIIKMGSIKPLIFGDPLTFRPDAMRKRSGIDEASFGILPKQDPLSSAATEHSGRPMGGPPGATQTGAAPVQM